MTDAMKEASVTEVLITAERVTGSTNTKSDKGACDVEQ